MGRALSLSFAAHVAFAVAFLLLSATRAPLPVPEAVRPVRLVAYLESPASPRTPAPGPVAAPPREAPAVPVVAPPAVTTAPERATPRAPAPARETATPAPGRVGPVAVPKLVIPAVPGSPAGGQPARRPSLGERLAKEIPPAAERPTTTAAPTLASLQRTGPRVEPPGPAPSAGRAPGATPGPPTAEAVGYFPFEWYTTLLTDNVYQRWAKPSAYYKGNLAPLALIAFRIDRRGRVSGIALRQGSGDPRFDQSALAAIRGLGQAPPLPEQYREETLDVIIRFQ